MIFNVVAVFATKANQIGCRRSKNKTHQKALASRFLLSVATTREARRSIFVIDEADEQGQRSVYIIRDCGPQRNPTKYRAKRQAAKFRLFAA